MQMFYILDHEDQPVPANGALQWAHWRDLHPEKAQVAKDVVDGVLISTVFLGMNHAFMDNELPLLFETMIFGGGHDHYQTRCSTKDQALIMHSKALKLVKGETNDI
jgi:hypothetical protein